METKDIVKQTRKNHKINQEKMADLIKEKWPQHYIDQSAVSRAEQGGHEKALNFMIQYFVEELGYESEHFFPTETKQRLEEIENDIKEIKKDMNEIKTLLTDFFNKI